MVTIAYSTKPQATSFSHMRPRTLLPSFLQIAMLNGWGGYVLTQAGYVNAFFSHDEYIDFFAKEASCLEEVRTALGATETRTPGQK